jgi:hypothetical protein
MKIYGPVIGGCCHVVILHQDFVDKLVRPAFYTMGVQFKP